MVNGSVEIKEIMKGIETLNMGKYKWTMIVLNNNNILLKYDKI